MAVIFDLMMRAITKDLCFSFGAEPSYWYGQGSFTYAKPFAPGAETLPLVGGEQLNLRFHRRSDASITSVVPKDGMHEIVDLQKRSGVLNDDEEALCIWCEGSGAFSDYHAIAFLKDESFALLTQVLMANQAQPLCLLVAAGFLGFRGPHLEGDQLPSLEEFRQGRPYLYHQTFNFAVTPAD